MQIKPSLLDPHLVGAPTESPRPVGRRWAVRVAVAGALLVGLLAGVLLSRQPAAPPTATPIGKAPTSTVPLAPSLTPSLTPPLPPALPPATPSDEVVPTTTPRGVTWQSFQGINLPYSPVAGPIRTDGAVVAGFAHTPTGALIASLQISSRYFVTPRAGWKTVTLEQVMPSPGRDRWINIRGAQDDAPPPQGYAQPAGFRYVTYTPMLAVLQVVFQMRNGAFSVNTVTMAWDREDWRLVVQANGFPNPPAIRVPTLVGFVPFGDF